MAADRPSLAKALFPTARIRAWAPPAPAKAAQNILPSLFYFSPKKLSMSPSRISPYRSDRLWVVFLSLAGFFFFSFVNERRKSSREKKSKFNSQISKNSFSQLQPSFLSQERRSWKCFGLQWVLQRLLFFLSLIYSNTLVLSVPELLQEFFLFLPLKDNSQSSVRAKGHTWNWWISGISCW